MLHFRKAKHRKCYRQLLCMTFKEKELNCKEDRAVTRKKKPHVSWITVAKIRSTQKLGQPLCKKLVDHSRVQCQVERHLEDFFRFDEDWITKRESTQLSFCFNQRNLLGMANNATQHFCSMLTNLTQHFRKTLIFTSFMKTGLTRFCNWPMNTHRG